DYTGPITLLSGQKLFGKGMTASIASASGLTVPADSIALPTTSGTAPNITSSGNDISLGSGNTVRGLSLGNATGVALSSGPSFGTLTVSETSINSTGQGLLLSTGTLSGGFTSITS